MIINKCYTNNDIRKEFGGSPQRGMRKHKNHLVLISDIDMNKNIYPDKLIGNTLDYTGMGKTGNQSINFMQNKTLYLSNKLGIHVYLFFKVKPNYYIYAGPVKLISKPHYEKDHTGRLVVKFPIASKLKDNNIKKIYIKSINLSTSQLSKRKLIKRVRNHEIDNNKHLIKNKYSVNTYKYIRNRNIAELSKRFANGRCQLCGRKMFLDQRTKEPYLESHHITPLHKGGKDSIFNVIALCPNCHRKLHFHYIKGSIKLMNINKKLHNKAARFATKAKL